MLKAGAMLPGKMPNCRSLPQSAERWLLAAKAADTSGAAVRRSWRLRLHEGGDCRLRPWSPTTLKRYRRVTLKQPGRNKPALLVGLIGRDRNERQPRAMAGRLVPLFPRAFRCWLEVCCATESWIPAGKKNDLKTSEVVRSIMRCRPRLCHCSNQRVFWLLIWMRRTGLQQKQRDCQTDAHCRCQQSHP